MEAVATKIYDNLHFSHKVHEKQCELLALGSIIMRSSSVLLIMIVLALQFVQFLLPKYSTTIAVISVAFTVVEVGLTVFQLNFNYDKLLDQHRGTAKALLSVKNRLLVDMVDTLNKDTLKQYVDELEPIYTSAPQTGKLAKKLVNQELH